MGYNAFSWRKQPGIKAESQFRMVTALQQELVAAPAESLFDLSFVGIDVRDIGIGVAGDAIEVAEFAVGDTHIGGIDVAVDLPGDLTMRDL